MPDQKEKAAQCEAAEKSELKCPVCGNERIKENHNYCGVCGSQLKEKPVVIDFQLSESVGMGEVKMHGLQISAPRASSGTAKASG